ncbi:MAG: 2-oxoglutarate dehydrogenase E1 component [Halobacteriovoraceae bacterium]|nr:2-oxoglutarate dehydrogenase E1 component [Halobacteriovoraceae bacterium]|tara:strand:- start:283 stop:3015 length:2733 start_codon:yes stop_codon:yes gene_type:complete
MTTKNDYSHLLSSDNAYVDNLYETYKQNPSELDESWQVFFKGFEYKLDEAASGQGPGISSEDLSKEINAFRIVQAYRARGHFLSDTNPIRKRKDRAAKLDASEYGLTEADLEREFIVGEFLGLGKTKLKNIIEHMRRIYCYKIGLEYYHSNNTDIRRWVRNKFEKEYHTIDLPMDQKKRILHKLNQATVFENFLQTKYIGQKRFSLEGGESTIPALDAMINKGVELGAKEFVFGMAHRGRLNVLANIIGKSYEFIFKEFTPGDDQALHTGGGDVKYHQGYSSIMKTANGKDAYLKIMHNPSHLEAVAPVALGYARAQSDIRYDKNTDSVVPVMIHGDAAVAGQGIVYETLQMAELPAYQCGGAIHFVINNQIGFTTDWHDGRSSHYCTSIARSLEAPIIHVNGDDPESVVYAMEFAIEFRQKFKTDIFIDMVCYRKHGHNEGDEPKYTQPDLYGLISKQKNPRELYLESMIKWDQITKEEAKAMEKEFKAMLSERFNSIKDKKESMEKKKGPHTEWLDLRWSKHEDFDSSPSTAVSKEILDNIVEKITSAPADFNVLKKAGKIMSERKKAYEEDRLDWALGELLAYGSLLTEGFSVRFSGQDVVRGTFSHRMSMLFDEKTAEEFCGLGHLKEGQGEFRIYNSHLSEYAVLGFEFGYSLASPSSLNIWEAQFGDFSNTAQVIVDQFISSSEVKWERMSGITMLLPHGYEGQGPEHSSCRPERYLQLCAQDNMIVCNPTTPANMFHLLRRQQAFEFRKPLVVFTPKSLLRSSVCTSPVSELTKGSFKEVIADEKTTKARRVLFCTGKIFYDLLSHKEENKIDDIAIIRLEQLYPFPTKQVDAQLKKYEGAEFIWVQEEPINMGYWAHLMTREFKTFMNFKVIARPMSATPATGYGYVHSREQENIITEAFKK